jgi:hypothetical protein
MTRLENKSITVLLLVCAFAFLSLVPTRTDAQEPVPRLANGKPDFTGVWDHARAGNLSNDSEGCGGVSAAAGGLDLTGSPDCTQTGAGPLPYTRSGQAARAENRNFEQGDNCWPWGYVRLFGTPFPHAYVHHPDRLAIFFEQDNAFKMVPTDGRRLPEELFPTWRGTAVGFWDGDTLVIESAGFNGKAWLDSTRNPNSEQLRVTERMSFIDANHINWEVTIDDPVYYTRPFKNTRTFLRMEPGEELYEYVCAENNRCVGGECTPSDVQLEQ